MSCPTRDQPPIVAVYSFRPLTDGWETSSVAPFKATREAIERVFVGDVLEGTREQVLPEELDALGRWRRVATAWGELR